MKEAPELTYGEAKKSLHGICECSLRTKVLSDGCSVCNPKQALEYATETIADLEADLELKAIALEAQLDEIKRLKNKLSLSLKQTKKYINMYHDLLEEKD